MGGGQRSGVQGRAAVWFLVVAARDLWAPHAGQAKAPGLGGAWGGTLASTGALQTQAPRAPAEGGLRVSEHGEPHPSTQALGSAPAGGTQAAGFTLPHPRATFTVSGRHPAFPGRLLPSTPFLSCGLLEDGVILRCHPPDC